MLREPLKEFLPKNLAPPPPNNLAKVGRTRKDEQKQTYLRRQVNSTAKTTSPCLYSVPFCLCIFRFRFVTARSRNSITVQPDPY
jgi:hypothetical protein